MSSREGYPGASLSMDVVSRLARMTVGQALGVKPELMLARPRGARTVAAGRQIAMRLCNVVAGRTYSEIAKSFGGRDRSTASYHAERLEWLMDDPAIEAFFDLLSTRLRLALELTAMSNGREAWREALVAMRDGLDSGLFEDDGISAATSLVHTFRERA